MKKFSSGVIVLLLLLIPSVSSAQTAPKNGPDEIVRRFYSWYLHRLNQDDLEPLKNRTVALRYLTPEFLRKIPRLVREMDADVIICAQDVDPEWEKNLKIGVPEIKTTLAKVDVQLDGRDIQNIKLKITLKRLAKGWRIDAVDCAE